MTINWGHKLTLVFIVFAGMMFTLVYKCMHTNYELVTKEYYRDELVYQKVIDGTKNANQLSEITSVTSDANQVKLALPAGSAAGAKGTIWFYCASSESKDRHFDLAPNAAGEQVFDRASFTAGHYTVKIQWESNGKQYFSEQALAVN